MQAFRSLYPSGASCLIASLLIASSAMAEEFGTAEEARAMLDNAALAIQSDREQALNNFNTGGEGFKDRDLYVFCADGAGDFVAHGNNQDLIGESILNFRDKNEKFFLAEIFSVAVEGEVSEIQYSWPRPGESELSEKISLVTKIGELVCGVGYYL